MENVGQVLCPDQFPENQPCSLPLRPGVYGGGDPILYGPMGDNIEIPEEYYIFFEGPYEVEVEVFYPDGSLFACNFVKLILAEHSPTTTKTTTTTTTTTTTAPEPSPDVGFCGKF